MTTASCKLSRDPICGKLLAEDQVVATYDYMGQTYRFCCCECRDFFARTPGQLIVQLAHEPEGHCGYPCPQQRMGMHGAGQAVRRTQ